MTKNQVISILNDLGYGTDMMIKASDISVISSDLDGLVYSGKNTRLYFNTVDSDSGLLEIYYGKENSNGEFIFKGEVPSYVYPFKIIYGITLTSILHIPEPYKFGQAV